MASSITAETKVTGASCTTPRRLPRSRSAEDLSREQLKNTENDTVLIFIEYVRKKLGNSSLRTAELDEEQEAERKQRERRLYGASEPHRNRGSLRRLQSEPNGPKSSVEREEVSLASRGPQIDTVAVCDTAKNSPRPTRLVLERPPSNKDERRHRASTTRSLSNHSVNSGDSNTPSAFPAVCESTGSSSATTPVPIPDPPLVAGSGGISPCDGPEFASSSYPPLSSHRLHLSSTAIAAPPGGVVAGLPVSQEYFCTAQQPLTPQLNRAATKRDSKWQRQHHAKIIANKLKIFGDEISSTHEEELQREFVHIITTHTNPRQVIEFFSLKLRHMLLGLSWQNIGKVFHLSYHLIEFLNELLGSSADMTGTREWAEFSELWDLTIGSVTRWISSNGGWRAFPADSSSSPTPSPDQPTCPATPSLRRVRSRLLSLSESGEFEFIDEGHPPLSADTISTTSSEIGLSDDREDRLGSSVDLLYDPLQESASESSMTTSPPYIPATITPVTVPPPCTLPTTLSTTPPACQHSPQVVKRCHGNTTCRSTNPSPPGATCTASQNPSSSLATCVPSSTVAFANGVAQIHHSTPKQCKCEQTPQRKKSHSLSEQGRSKTADHLTRTGSLPASSTRQRVVSSRRASQTALNGLNGLVIGVGGAAVVYAAVSALLKR